MEVMNLTSNTFDQFHNWVGTTFDEHVTIRDLCDLWSANNATADLLYNGSLLAVTNVTFNSVWAGPNSYMNNTGDLSMSVQNLSVLVSGDVDIAVVTFEILNQGTVLPYPTGGFDSSGRHLMNMTLFSRYSILGEIPLWPEVYDGDINVYALDVHDVAVVGVTSFKTDFSAGYPGNVTVTAANLGAYLETFNVTVYANTTMIASQNVTLSSGNSTSIIFTWDVTGFAYGNYTVSAYAWPVTNETNAANNNCTGNSVTVSLVGDLTGPNGVPDGKVDIRDVHFVAALYSTTPSSSNWNANADINNDDKVDIRDVHIAAANYGQHYP
jgi:hypothetical protein